MKKTLQNTLKVGAAIALMLSAGAVSAQRVTPVSPATAADFTKAAAAELGKSGGSVKVVDNKGTIKYLQAKNGVTMFTDKAPDGGVVTTWQLGGTLTDDTYIDATGKIFGIKGLKGLDPTTNVVSDIPVVSYTAGTGFTLMVRDEATGEIKKMIATDLVTGIKADYTQAADATGNIAILVNGLPLLTGNALAKLFVFRNGAKLRSGVDFTPTANTVTITYSAADLPMYKGDAIEIQYIK